MRPCDEPKARAGRTERSAEAANHQQKFKAGGGSIIQPREPAEIESGTDENDPDCNEYCSNNESVRANEPRRGR
jgi:hypothetical protein